MPASLSLKAKKLTATQLSRNILAVAPFHALLGLRVASVHPDGVTVECSVRDELRNAAGALHGGVHAALADAAVGMAIYRHFGESRRIVTVELKVNYFAKATAGKIFARSHLLRIGSTLCVGTVDLIDAQRQLIGTGIVTFMLLNDATSV